MCSVMPVKRKASTPSSSSGAGPAIDADAFVKKAKKTVAAISQQKIGENLKGMSYIDTDITTDPTTGITLRAMVERDVLARENGATGR